MENESMVKVYFSFCLFILFCMRLTGLAVPYLFQTTVDEILKFNNKSNHSNSTSFEEHAKTDFRIPSFYIVILVLVLFLDLSFLSSMRMLIWSKIKRAFRAKISNRLHLHIQKQPLDWHLAYNQDESFKLIIETTQSVDLLTRFWLSKFEIKIFVNFLNFFSSCCLFDILPIFLDSLIAIVYFTVAFNLWFGILIFLSVSLYVCKFQFVFFNELSKSFSDLDVFLKTKSCYHNNKQ